MRAPYKLFRIVAGIAVMYGIYSLVRIVLHYLQIKIIPASIAGIIVLFLMLLLSGRFAKFMQDASKFTLDNMAIFFMPMFVGLVLGGKLPQGNIFILIVLMCISSLITLLATAFAVECHLNRRPARCRDDKQIEMECK